jgi:NADH:ubiquinone oxidoreductase subunit K
MTPAGFPETVPLTFFQLLSAALFAIGLYGVLARRSAVLIVMSIELMLNAVNINLIAAASYLEGEGSFLNFDGQIIAIFVITIAAAEVGLALAIILRMYRNRSTVDVDEINLMKW